jgi:hypothetical protein
MAEEDVIDDTIEGSVGNAEPDVEVITLDGEEVAVPKGYGDKLKKIETEMKSGLNRKHEAKQRDLAAKLKADKDWLNTHADKPELWALYEPTVDGGRGFIGSENMETQSSTTTVASKPTTEQNSEVMELRRKIEDLEKKVTSVETNVEETTIGQASSTRDKMLSKYPNVDKEILTDKMLLYLANNNKHASPEMIEDFAKKENDRIEKFKGKIQATAATTTTQTTDTTTLPKVSNTPPDGTKPKRIRIDDVNANIKDMEEMGIRFNR